MSWKTVEPFYQLQPSGRFTFCEKVRFEPSSLLNVSFIWVTSNGWEHEQTGLGNWLLSIWYCVRLIRQLIRDGQMEEEESEALGYLQEGGKR